MANATIDDILGAAKLFQWDASIAGSIYEDAAATDTAEDADIVLAWEDQCAGELLTVVANGPTYRADYASSGYAGLEFDGTNDVLSGAMTGVASGAVLGVLWVGSVLSSASTLISRGNSGAWTRIYSGTASQQIIQQSAGGSSSSDSRCPTKRSIAWLTDVGRTQIYCIESSNYNTDSISSQPSVSNTLTLCALNTGSPSQFGNCVVHEVVITDSTVGWWDLVECVTVLNDKWGITDPNPTPQAAAGGGLLRVGMAGGFSG